MSFNDPFSKDPAGPDGAGGNPGGSVPAVESVDEQLATVTARLDEVETEKRDLHERLLRAAAELDNFKKRVRREQVEAARYAAEPLVRELIPVVDNLERAVSHAESGGSSLVEGVALVLKSFHDVLRQHGVKSIEAVAGDPFDPNLHEAVERREVDGPANRIVQQWEKGYQMHERLLRPARVTVSAARPSAAVANGNDRD